MKWVARGTISIMGKNRHENASVEYQIEFTQANSFHAYILYSLPFPSLALLPAEMWELLWPVGRLH
jgi:hypothetical protein